MRFVRAALHTAAVVAIASVPVVILAPTPAGAVTAEFTTVGTSNWTPPDGVSCVAVTAIGAGGGVFQPTTGDGARGGSGTSTFPVVSGLALEVTVGGRGGDAFSSGSIPGAAGAGGFNGGGAGGLATIDGASGYFPGAGGGGASDVRINGTDLEHRVVVGGGGGGAGGFGSASTGVGGGEDGGSAALESDASGGTGGSQGVGGTGGSTDGIGKNGVDGEFGAGGTGGGGSAVNGGGGGGGGGWFGGGGGGGVPPGGGTAAGGGGGSGFGDVLASGVDAENGGNGRVTFTYAVGDTSCLEAPLTVKKVVSGSTTPGQTFTVHVACEESSIRLGGSELSAIDLHFVVDGAGVAQPATGIAIGFSGPNVCTVTESATGGATSTSYACVGSGASDTEASATAGGWGVRAATAGDPDDPCATSGPQATPVSVAIVAPGQEATVTITNAFAAAAVPVALQPRFTG